MAEVTLHHGDCLDVLRELPDASVDAVVTDPPYLLGFMGREWDTRAAHQHLDWHRAWCDEALRVLKPGGHLLAFGGTRTWHRLACAVEDAGFEVRDSIAWLYGSGFPKSLDVSKAIDKRGGNAHLASEIAAAIKTARESRGWTAGQADRHFCGGSTNWTWYEGRKGMCRPPTPADFARIAAEWPELAPLAEMVAEADREVTGTGQAGLTAGSIANFRGTKTFDITAPATPDAERWQGWGTALKPAHEPIVVARKPLAGTVAANVLAHGTGALNVDGCRVEGEALRDPRRADGTRSQEVGHEGWDRPWKQGEQRQEPFDPTRGRWPANVVLDESQAEALDAQSGEVGGSGGTFRDTDRQTYNAALTGTLNQPQTPSDYGKADGASRFMYVAKADTSERVRVNGTAHPTVKPLALMRWLVRLVTPPGGTVLEPFAGSGTTVEACLLEGFKCIAIEREADYLPLIRQRINRRRDPVEAVRSSGEDGGLFDLLGEEPA